MVYTKVVTPVREWQESEAYALLTAVHLQVFQASNPKSEFGSVEKGPM